MNTLPFSNYRLLLVLLLLMLASAVLSALRPRLDLIGDTAVWGGSCQPGMYVIAGSPFFVKVNNTIDQPLALRKPGWPDGYTLEAALDLASGQDFVPTAGLIDRLQPEPFLSMVNLAHQSDGKFNPADAEELNLKHFALHIPSDLAGHRLALRARYNGNGVTLTSGLVGPVEIIPPCDKSDTARIMALRIFEAWDRADNKRAVEIADSMLLEGLSDAAGWAGARNAAHTLGLPEKEIAYLDRLYQDFGVLHVQLGTESPPRLNPQGLRTPEEEQRYQHQRNGLLRQIEKQQQQQH